MKTEDVKLEKRITDELLSVKERGLINRTQLSTTKAGFSVDNFAYDFVATVSLNPLFDGERSVYTNPIPDEIWNSVELCDSNNVWNWDTGGYLQIVSHIGQAERYFFFSKTKYDADLMDKLKTASQEELQEHWTKQIVYEHSIGLLSIACERSGSKMPSKDEVLKRLLNNLVFVFRVKDFESQILEPQRSDLVYNAGEVDLTGPIPSMNFASILVPCHLSGLVRSIGFETELVNVPIIFREGQNIPNYEAALNEIIARNKEEQFFAHIKRLPTEWEID